jgi:hypothetical protein
MGVIGVYICDCDCDCVCVCVCVVMKDPAFSTTRFVLLRRNYVKQAVATLR